MPRILIIEDDANSRKKLKSTLEQHPFIVEDVASIAEAIENHALPSFDLIITDLRLPGQPGTDVIQLAQGVPVLVMTSYAGLRSAVDAIKLGAVDYIAKPFEQADILEIINNIISTPTPQTVTQLNEKQAEAQISQYIYGRCPAMKKVFTLMRKTAPTDATVLIQGETGSGKELAARAIHQLSHRRTNHYICINCAAIPETLIESELFGHEKGSFTGAIQSRTGVIEAADGGTLFLDEIGELPLRACCASCRKGKFAASARPSPNASMSA
jgi:two-component system, NtrC family, response regulator HydG